MAQLEQNALVWQRLDVGPVTIEKKRIKARYAVTTEKGTEETFLSFSYEEEVFDPATPADSNLAMMIAVQPALNYGLFAKEIVFHGLFDAQDRRFIRDMTENTSREIYVNKLLAPNVFLTGEMAKLKPEKRDRYTLANLRFEKDPKTNRAPWKMWNGDPSRYAVLSSGGKDSLLTYGLLNEAGLETHPLFVNESGRHWFTALNSYRHFSESIAHTGRVWTDCDRLFNFMLRQMPFIRKDYADVRADMYPIRLWTVAVFLFAVLPVVRRRGIGRLLIGDEYDTTLRETTHGIRHYAGLFDQSRFFDEQLSRYFLAKGWAIAQFSVLRPLSELLIMKILSNRYPQLQAQQVSCHAAHKGEDGRIYPCGKCEKCRRIVGMLQAIGGDPKNCGYNDRQIEECLEALMKGGIHQEEEGYLQMMHMLQQKKKIPLQPAFRSHPEVLMLRFDREHAMPEYIPADLRHQIYPLLLEEAQGALRKRGKSWQPFDLWHSEEMRKAYAFDALPSGSASEHPGDDGYLWGEMSWPEAEEYLKQVDVALLPVGAIEQHGPHLPLDVDAYDADYLARQVAAACSPPRPLVLPLIAYGVSYHHDEFKGTLSVTNETLARMVYEIGMSVARNGIKKLLILNGHGGNDATLNFAAQMINRDAHIFVGVDSGETSDADIYEMVETPNDVHAGEFETSTTLALRPHLVKMDKAKSAVPEFSSRYLDYTSRRGVSWHAHTKKISEDGTMGDPTKASAEKGRRMWKIMIAHLVAFVEELKRLSLDEIHQKKY